MSQTGAPPARLAPTVVWTGDRLLAFGGTDPGGVYSPCSDSWAPMPAIPSNMLDLYARPLAARGRLIYYGRFYPASGVLDAELFAYDYPSNAWSVPSTVGTVGAEAQGVGIANNSLATWGGAVIAATSPNFRYAGTNAGAVYDFAADQWTPTSVVGAPSARIGTGNIAWNGSALAVWGGAIADTSMTSGGVPFNCWGTPGPGCPLLGDGAIYDPESGRWAPMSAANAPSARSEHLLVWAGSRVLVWGGQNVGLVDGLAGWITLFDGALYDPSTDSWSPVAAAPFDSSYVGGAPLWSGTRMVVFNGQANDGSGWIYDPQSDHWTALAIASPPLQCAVANVQAGSVVFKTCTAGGQSVIARLDPIINEWSTVALPANVPEVPEVIWTGKRWFVWGGQVVGPTPPNPCPNLPPSNFGCDPPGPTVTPSNEGWTLVP